MVFGEFHEDSKIVYNIIVRVILYNSFHDIVPLIGLSTIPFIYVVMHCDNVCVCVIYCWYRLNVCCKCMHVPCNYKSCHVNKQYYLTTFTNLF